MAWNILTTQITDTDDGTCGSDIISVKVKPKLVFGCTTCLWQYTLVAEDFVAFFASLLQHLCNALSPWPGRSRWLPRRHKWIPLSRGKRWSPAGNLGAQLSVGEWQRLTKPPATLWHSQNQSARMRFTIFKFECVCGFCAGSHSSGVRRWVSCAARLTCCFLSAVQFLVVIEHNTFFYPTEWKKLQNISQKSPPTIITMHSCTIASQSHKFTNHKVLWPEKFFISCKVSKNGSKNVLLGGSSLKVDPN